MQISPEAKQYFVDNYCSLRGADSTGTNKSAYRITVRQLESMIRLAEARARLDLENEVTPSHVKEAARLLKKSIVHVENRDVELEDDEEDLLGLPDGAENAGDAMDDSGNGGDDDDNNGGGDEGGAGGPSGGDEKEERSAAKKKGGAAAPKSGSSQAEGKEGEAAAAAAAASSDSAAAPARREVKLGFSEYQRITLLLVKFMRSRESAESMTTSWKDLVNYFINESLSASGAVASESGVITSEAELAERTRIVELVIHRLIKTDHILLMVKKSNDKSKRMLQVHPNFTGEGEAIDHGASDRAPPKEPKPAKGTIDAELLEKRQAEQILQGLIPAQEPAPEEEEQKAQPMDEDEAEAPATPQTPVQKRGGSKASTPARTPSAAARAASSAAASSQGSGRSSRSRK